MFDFSEVEVKQGGSRIEPGVSNVTITGLIHNESDNYLEITFVSDDNSEHKERMYMSENAMPWTMMKLKHLGLLLVEEEKFNKIKTPKQLNALFSNKKFRVKFRGVEREKEGNIYINAELGLPPFAETLEVSEEESKLKFDPMRDIKRLNVQSKNMTPVSMPSVNSTEEDDDLPF